MRREEGILKFTGVNFNNLCPLENSGMLSTSQAFSFTHSYGSGYPFLLFIPGMVRPTTRQEPGTIEFHSYETLQGTMDFLRTTLITTSHAAVGNLGSVH